MVLIYFRSVLTKASTREVFNFSTIPWFIQVLWVSWYDTWTTNFPTCFWEHLWIITTALMHTILRIHFLLYLFVLCLFAEQMRQQKRELNKTQRQLARDQTALERQEKQLVRQIVSWTFVTVWTKPLDHHAKSLDHQLVIVYSQTSCKQPPKMSA